MSIGILSYPMTLCHYDIWALTTTTGYDIIARTKIIMIFVDTPHTHVRPYSTGNNIYNGVTSSGIDVSIYVGFSIPQTTLQVESLKFVVPCMSLPASRKSFLCFCKLP